MFEMTSIMTSSIRNVIVLSVFLQLSFGYDCAGVRVAGVSEEDRCIEKTHDTSTEMVGGKQENESINVSHIEANSSGDQVDEVIESIGSSEVYEALGTTRQYEGDGYVTRSIYSEEERAGVYEEPSFQTGKVLEPDHKEGERETLLDQPENKNDSNKSQVDGEHSMSTSSLKFTTVKGNETSGDLRLFATGKGEKLETSINLLKDDQLNVTNTSLTTETTETKIIHSISVVDNYPISNSEKLTTEEIIGDVWNKNIQEEIHFSQDSNITNNNSTKDPGPFKLTVEETKKMGKDNKSLTSNGELNKNIQIHKDFKFIPDTNSTVNKSFTVDMSLTTDTSSSIDTSTTDSNSTIVVTKPDENILTTESAYIKTFTRSIIKNELKFPDNSSDILVDKEPTHPLHIHEDLTESSQSVETNETSPETLPRPERLFGFNIERDDEYYNVNNRVDDKTDQREDIISQSLLDYEDKEEEDKVAIKSLLSDHPTFKKEKIEPGVLFEDCTDCDFRVLPIRASEQRNTPKVEQETLPSPKIRFSELPEGRELQIYSLGLSDGIFLFSYLSEFLSWIQPNEFPVELLRDALRNEISWVSLITQSLQVEAGFVTCLVVGVLLALAVPVVVLSHACYRMRGKDEDTSEDATGCAMNCRRRTLVFILQILLVFLFAGMAAMFVTNEQLSSAVVQSSNVIQTSLSDVSAFVHNSHLQLHFLVTQSLDQVLQAIYADLENVDTLLGRPIQRELIRETGLDVALESLSDLTREAKETTHQVEKFLEEARIVQEMVVSSMEKLSDLRQQVELFRRACGPRDRTLCDTIDASGLEITLRLDRIRSDERLNRMRRMGGVGLEAATIEAKEHFMTVPNRVETDTRDARETVRRQLTRQRAEVDDKSLLLERFARDMTSKVNEAKYQASFWMQDLDQFEYWRWIICLGGGVAVLMIWMLLVCSMCCGCCGSEKAAGPTILVTIVLLCLFTTALWSMALIGMVVGGHGEVFVCRPLYDEPEFHVISRLVDQPGVFYSEHKGGFIANVIYGNDTLDVPIKQVLQDCRANRAIYPTMGLHRVFDVEGSVDQHRWNSVNAHLRSVRANLSSLEVMSPALSHHLADLLNTLSVNFTEHRIQMSRPVTGKDMDSFARQLDNIGNQMRDLATASRMETLSSRTQRLIDSHIRPLEGRKDALVYQLTALEVQTGPLQRQVNQSLSHLKTIQFFINSQGESIAQRKSREYVDRLLSYVDQLRSHVVETASNNVSPCRPLWDIFNTTRLFLCRHTMDPLNGYWFATMWCLIVLLVATPVCLKLVDYYRAKGFKGSGSPENLMVSEQGAGWSSPGYDIKYSKEYGNEYK